MTFLPQTFEPVYGPVASWRFGRSLGIDAVGPISTCPFNCVYCQLGDIQHQTIQRQVFVSTAQIHQAIKAISPATAIDVVTLSGNGEPTLALNLNEIVACIKAELNQPVVVLTNGTLLRDPAVRAALKLADQVVVKLYALSASQLQRINHPVAELDWPDLLSGIKLFSDEYLGYLSVQTMVLTPWSDQQRADYIQLVQEIMPEEIQLNAPTRPRMLSRHLEARGNQAVTQLFGDARKFQHLKCVSVNTLQDFATEIEAASGILTRYPLLG